MDNTKIAEEKSPLRQFMEWMNENKLWPKNEIWQIEIDAKLTELFKAESALPATPATQERFKKPTDEQIVKAALLFGDGNLDDKGRLTDMVGLCLWVVDRLYENGDILIPSSKENQE